MSDSASVDAERVTVRLSEAHIDRLDELVRNDLVANRSAAIRYAVQEVYTQQDGERPY